MRIVDCIKNEKKNNILPTDEDMALINQYTRRELTKDEVYVFSLVLCDNDVDKSFECFTLESLFELRKLYIGKTGILSHNQTARIFSCKVKQINGKKTKTGEHYYQLVAKAYIVKTDSNKNITRNIELGNLKEISIGCAVKNRLCSICSNDIHSYSCTHTKGKKYKRKLCYCKLVDVVDAYEFAVVADTVNKRINNYEI